MPDKYKLALYYQQLVNRVGHPETHAELAFVVAAGEFKILVKAWLLGCAGYICRREGR